MEITGKQGKVFVSGCNSPQCFVVLKMILLSMILLSMILPILQRRFAAESWDAKGLAVSTIVLRSALPRDVHESQQSLWPLG
jgi:hypothetical protein